MMPFGSALHAHVYVEKGLTIKNNYKLKNSNFPFDHVYHNRNALQFWKKRFIFLTFCVLWLLARWCYLWCKAQKKNNKTRLDFDFFFNSAKYSMAMQLLYCQISSFSPPRMAHTLVISSCWYLMAISLQMTSLKLVHDLLFVWKLLCEMFGFNLR